MNAITAAAEIAVRPLRFGDPVLIEAMEVLDTIAELEFLTGNSNRDWDRIDIVELRRHLENKKRALAASAAGGRL